MNLIKNINNFLNKILKKATNSQDVESYGLSIIDTSTLQIDENLTTLEKDEYKKLIAEIKQGDISTIIIYGDDVAKTINHYMDISRKRINQNIEENKSTSRLISTEEIIKHKLKIIFNNAEIDNIIRELNELCRKCEIRVLALKKVGEDELKKSKRKINIFTNKYDLTKVNSINNAISRLSSSIKIILMLVHSIQIEQYNCKIENDAIDRYLVNNNPDENSQIANKVLNNTFNELKQSLIAIRELSSMPLNFVHDIKIDEINFEEQSIDYKIDIIANAKKYLDLYVMQNRTNLFKEDGILNRASKNLDKLWEEIESDYYDWDLWAKKIYGIRVQEDGKKINVVEEKYSDRLKNIEKIISIFDEEIPKDFKNKFYKTKFYYRALTIETKDKDTLDIINTDLNEKEKSYYIKFLSEIIEKVHIQSQDGELLEFMNKNLAIKDIDKIITDYKRFVALLRIEKYGRNGLFTMIMYDHKYQRSDSDYHKDFKCRALDMEDKNKLNSIVKDRIYFLKDEATLQQLYGTSSHFCLEVLKLWENTEKTNSYSCFFGDYDNRKSNVFWKKEDNSIFVFSDTFLIPRDILKKGIAESRNDENLKFIARFSYEINRKFRVESSKPESEKSLDSKVIFSDSSHPCSLAEFLAGFACSIEEKYLGDTKNQVMNKLLNLKSIRTNDFDEMYQFVFYLLLEIYSEHYRDVAPRITIIDREYKRFYENLTKKILSGFSGNEIELENNSLDYGYIKFFYDTRRMVKEKINQYSDKPECEQLWNTDKYLDVCLFELITMVSKGIEQITGGEISKEDIRNRILNYHSIRKEESMLYIIPKSDEKGEKFDISKWNKINEITEYFILNLLATEEKFNKIDKRQQENVLIFCKVIYAIIYNDYHEVWSYGYIRDLYESLSTKIKAKIFKFPKQSFDIIAKGIGYYRTSKEFLIREREIIKKLSNIGDGEQPKSNIEYPAK